MRRQKTFGVRPREGELPRWRQAAGDQPLNAWIRRACNQAAEEAADLRERDQASNEVVALARGSAEIGIGPLTRHVEDGLTDRQRDLLRRRSMYDARLSFEELQERLRAAEAMERGAREPRAETPEPDPEAPADELSAEDRRLLQETGMYVEGEVPPAIRREHLRRAQAMVPRAEQPRPGLPALGLSAEDRRLLQAKGLGSKDASPADLRAALERDRVRSRQVSGMWLWFARRQPRGWR